jgi:hypothetical protein
MPTVHLIRHHGLVDGRRVRHVARERGRSRPTVYPYVARPPPSRGEASARRHAVVAVVAARSDPLVPEGPSRPTAQPRLTAARLHRPLRTAGATVRDRAGRQDGRPHR